MDYLIHAQKDNIKTTAETIAFAVQIDRDGDNISSFVQGYPATMSDDSIRIELIRRIQEFIKVDSGIIEETQVEERADAIAASIDGHMETV